MRAQLVRQMMVAAACAALFPATAARASAWNQKEGEGLLITTFAADYSNRRFDTAGNQQSSTPFRKASLSPYLEYGLTEPVTIGVQPVLLLMSNNVAGTTQVGGFGDTDLFTRFNLHHDAGNSLGLQLTYTAPGPYSTNARPLPGDGQSHLKGSLLYAHDFSTKVYMDTEFGYRVRLGTVLDQFEGAFTLGYHASDKWLLLGQLFASIATNSAPTPNYSTYDFYHVMGSAVRELDSHLSLQLGYGRDVAGSNAILDNRFVAALWVRF